MFSQVKVYSYWNRVKLNRWKQDILKSVFSLVTINSYSSRIKVNRWKQGILNSVLLSLNKRYLDNCFTYRLCPYYTPERILVVLLIIVIVSKTSATWFSVCRESFVRVNMFINSYRWSQSNRILRDFVS